MTHYENKIEEIRTYSPFVLSSIADTGSPDGVGSPGAVYLSRVRDTVLEDLANGHTVDDIVFDEGSLTVYTHAIWQTFVDLAAYQEDLSEYGYEYDCDSDLYARVALYLIGERLASELVSEIREAQDEDEEEIDEALRSTVESWQVSDRT